MGRRPAVLAAAALLLASAPLPACQREQKAIEHDLPAARGTKAKADCQQIAEAIRAYQATFGSLPEELEDITEARNDGGVTGGPFLARIPTPPAGWSPYAYTRQSDTEFTVTSSAGAATVSSE